MASCACTLISRRVSAFVSRGAHMPCSRRARSDADTNGGQRLLCLSEFHAQTEAQAVLTVLQRARDDELQAHSLLLLGGTDGSLASLRPLDAAVHRRLLLLHGQIARNVQQFAGLNPRAFRCVRGSAHAAVRLWPRGLTPPPQRGAQRQRAAEGPARRHAP